MGHDQVEGARVFEDASIASEDFLLDHDQNLRDFVEARHDQTTDKVLEHIISQLSERELTRCYRNAFRQILEHK